MKLIICSLLLGLSSQLIPGMAWCDTPLTEEFLLRYGETATVFSSSHEGAAGTFPVFRICNTTSAEAGQTTIEVVLSPQQSVGATHPQVKHIKLQRFDCVFAQAGQIDLQTDPVFAHDSLRVAIDGPHAASLIASVTLVNQ